MNEIEIVAAFITALNAAEIPHMIVGSLSSNAYGIERSTKDADFVVQLGSIPLRKLLEYLPPGFHIEPQIGFETITSSTRYRVRYQPLAFLIELFEVNDEPYDATRFQRRIATTYGGQKSFLPRPEDVVVTKLRWSRGGKSRAKDVDDVRNVLAVQGDALDLTYIRHWCDQHGTRELFEQLWTERVRLPETEPPV